MHLGWRLNSIFIRRRNHNWNLEIQESQNPKILELKSWNLEPVTCNLEPATHNPNLTKIY